MERQKSDTAPYLACRRSEHRREVLALLRLSKQGGGWTGAALNMTFLDGRVGSFEMLRRV